MSGLVVGVDPGLSGAMVALDAEGSIVDVLRFKDDFYESCHWLIAKCLEYHIQAVYVEKQSGGFHSKKANENKGMMNNTARLINYGRLLGCIGIGLDRPDGVSRIAEVTAKAWQAKVVKPWITELSQQELDAKEKAAVAVGWIFNTEQCKKWMSRPRAEGYHDGVVDAACIAYYGLQQEGGHGS